MSKEHIIQISPSDLRALKNFVTLERDLLNSNPLFVPEIDADVIKQLSGESAFFSEMEHTLFVASGDGRDVARCAALINRRYQKAKNEAVGFIGYFAAAPDSGAQVQAMLEVAEAWLKERSVTRIIAPFNGAGILGLGVRTAAFDEEPVYPMKWNPPYYSKYLVDAGYEPAYPLWSYIIDFSSDKYQAAARRAAGNNTVQVRPINKKRWNEDLDIFRQTMDESLKDEWEVHPHTSEEMHEFFDPLKSLLDTHQFLFSEVEGNPVGLCFGLPNWGPLMRSFNGKLGAVQGIKFMFAKERYSSAGLYGICILPGLHGKGIGRALAINLYRKYQERGLKEAAYHPVNEANTGSRKFAESMGGTGRVLYHCFDKSFG